MRTRSLAAVAVPVLALSLAPLLSGCVAAAVGGAVVAVSAVRQERTIGNAVDDVRIKSALTTSLETQSATNFVNVSTTVIEGRVLLTGRVATPEARLDASRAAWSIEGVRKVDNEIEVTEDGRWLNRPKDIYIRTRLAADLLTDMEVKDVNYTIDVVDGTVYLMGVGQNQAEIDKVIADAHDIPDVKAVKNYVVLKTDPIRYGMAVRPQPTREATAEVADVPRPAPARSAVITVSPEPAPHAATTSSTDANGYPDDGAGDTGEATGAPAQLVH